MLLGGMVDQQQKMLETGTVLVPRTDPHYPARLKEIFDPPIVLFARGRLDLLQLIAEPNKARLLK
jgi:DNA processing protein